jgi:DNA polymerase delta subunit 3
MLFEFHQKQNAKKPGSVHATYLITGTRLPPKPRQSNNTESQESEDAVMQNSPPIPNSSAPQAAEDDIEPVPVRSILLVKEEHLQKAKATFEEITGIHMYSLASGGLSDLNSLTECNRKIGVEYASEDPLLAWKQYGTIQNPNVKRRTQKRPPPAASAPATKEAPKPKPIPMLEKQASKASNESGPDSAKATPVPEKNTDASKKKTATKPTTVKRQPSDIFKSFARGANKAKVASAESSAAPSPAPTTSAKEDESMGGMSDDDPDDPVDDEEIEVEAGNGKSKKDREADLKAMMDVDDEPMEDVEEDTDQGAIDTPKESEAEDSQGTTKQEEPKETMTVENGRRRGRRRVMKKKTVKDDEGYLGEFLSTLSPHNPIY